MSDLETVERIAALETQYVKDQMLIDRLNRRNAELLDALKDAKSEIEWSIVRTVLVYGRPQMGRENLLTLVKKKNENGEVFKVFTDQLRTPTYVE